MNSFPFLFVFINTLPQVHSYTHTRSNKEEIFVSSFSWSNFSSRFGVAFSYLSFESSIKGCSYQVMVSSYGARRKSNKRAKKNKTRNETNVDDLLRMNHRWRNQRKTWNSTRKSQPKNERTTTKQMNNGIMWYEKQKQTPIRMENKSNKYTWFSDDKRATLLEYKIKYRMQNKWSKGEDKKTTSKNSYWLRNDL